MAEINAKDVMELRRITGAGMMDCKKALAESGGNLEEAQDWLRTHGLAKAAKKAGREANEGLIRIHKTDSRHGCMLVLNCETDFVARTDDFTSLADGLVKHFATADVPAECIGAQASEQHIEQQILPMAFDGGTVGEALTAAIAKMGENMGLSKLVIERSEDAGDFLQEYLHGNRVGVLVCLTTGKPETHTNAKFLELAKDLALQIAFTAPESVDRDGVPPALVDHERKVLTEQAIAEGKPAEIAAKMVEGRLGKFFSEVCLLEQAYVKEEKQKVKDVIDEAAKELGDTVTVARFHRFQLGE